MADGGTVAAGRLLILVSTHASKLRSLGIEGTPDETLGLRVAGSQGEVSPP